MYWELCQRPKWFSYGLEAANCFHKKIFIFIWEASNYVSLAVSFSCIVNKITGEDTEVQIHKYFFRKSVGNVTGKTPVFLIKIRKLQVLGPVTLLKRDSNTNVSCKICKILKSTFFYRRSLVVAFKISNSNNPTIFSKIFHQYLLRTGNIWSPAFLTITN